MADFQSILDQKVGEVERPKPLPRGTYLTVVAGPPVFTKVGADQTDAADFQLKVLQPGSDVDPAAIAAVEGGVMGKTIRARYFLTPDAVYRLDEFLSKHLGIEGNMSLREAMAQAPGRQVYATVVHNPNKEGTAFFANLGSTARV